MSKKRSIVNDFSELIIGICFIVFSIIVFIGRNNLYFYVVNLMVFVFLLLSIIYFLRVLFNSIKSDNLFNRDLFSCLFNLCLSLILSFFPNISLGILPFVFSLYLFLMGCSYFVSYFLFLSNNVKKRRRTLLYGFFYFIISVPILLSPFKRIGDFLLFVSLYSFFLGVSFCGNFFEDYGSNSKIRNKIRVNVPKIVEAVIPYSVMVKINKFSDNGYDFGNSKDANLFILIHASSSGVNMFGHADIFFDGYVYSFGNYDEGSRKYREMFGDGVLFETDRLKDYVNFCIDNSKKTIFVFGIKLTKRECVNIRKKIDSIVSNTYSWDYKMDKMINSVDTYSLKLYHSTNASFYKFKTGKYKTYFVLGANCCYLAADILGRDGINLFSVNGLVTPGTFYDYLDRKLKSKNTSVVSKNVYNKYRKMI